MTILVTGGAGYIGSHMAWKLHDIGALSVVLDDLSTGRRELVPPSAVFVEGDVADEALVGRLLGEHAVDTVIHFAAKTVVPESVSAPLLYYAANTCKTRSLIEGAVKAGVRRFVFSSTAAVYGEVGDEPVSEDHPLAPVSPYGASKAMSERILQDAAAAHGLSYAILRYFNVAGADPEGRTGQAAPDATHLIKVAVEAAAGKREGVTVFGTDYPTPDGTCIRDYIHVSDLVDAHWRALEHLQGGGEDLILNCGYGRGASVLEVLEAVQQVSGRRLDLRFGPRRIGDPSQVIARADKIRSVLSWTPLHFDIHRVIQDAFDWENSGLIRRTSS